MGRWCGSVGEVANAEKMLALVAYLAQDKRQPLLLYVQMHLAGLQLTLLFFD